MWASSGTMGRSVKLVINDNDYSLLTVFILALLIAILVTYKLSAHHVGISRA